MKKTKTVINIQKQEEKSIMKIRDFLRANAGLAYSAKDIADEIGIDCVEYLLYFVREEYATVVGIRRMVTIDKTSHDYCQSQYKYYCKSPFGKRWSEFWDFWADMMLEKMRQRKWKK
jgi:hypothetical protein